MKTIKRIFLIAGYDKNGKINSALVHQVKSFAKYGDCVLVMDSDCDESEITKIKPYCLYVAATRHGEYDFGSYKRAFIWATENTNLSNYDFMYMVNDSVYGPLFDIGDYLNQMESLGTDAFGMVKKTGGRFEHIQSWFIGMTQKIFLSKWFSDFITSVKKVETKTMVTALYENGFTRKLNENKIAWRCIYKIYNRGIYNRIKHLYKIRMPFIKKLSFTRHFGAYGNQILYVLNHIPKKLRDDILLSARETFGTKYIDWFLTKNPVKILARKIKYITSRLLCKN
jgi:lipopolysaccharide biosynthesis protein